MPVVRSTSWLTDARREMAVELHRELLESGASSVRRRLQSPPVEAPSPVDAGASWDEETPVDTSLDEQTEPEALWRALAELEAEPAERLPEPPRGPQARRRTPSSPWGIAAAASPWPATEWGMPIAENIAVRAAKRLEVVNPTAPTQPDRPARARRLAHGTSDPTAPPQRAFDVLVTARRPVSSHVVLARRPSALPAKATSRPTVLSTWEIPAQRWSPLALVLSWLIGVVIVVAGLAAAGMALP